MFSTSIKHLDSNTGTFLASSSKVESSNTDCSVKATRKHWELDVDYTIKEDNDSLGTQHQSHFPEGTYSELNYTPQRPNHTFLGWFDSPGPSTVPKGLTRLKYLHLSGTQYIDTGIAPGNNEIEFEIKYNDYAGSQAVRYYFGAQGTSNIDGSTYSAGYSSLSGIVAGCCGPYVSEESECMVPLNVVGDGPYTLKYTGTSAIVTGSSGGSTSIAAPITGTKETCLYNCYLGCCNKAGTAYLFPQNGDIYYCKIWKNGVLVRDYVPVLDSSNVAAFWDQINDTINYSAGSSFIAGPSVVGVEIPYVSMNYTQYINSGITPGNNEVQFELLVKFKSETTTNAVRMRELVGSRVGSFGKSNATDYSIKATPYFYSYSSTGRGGFNMGCLCPVDTESKMAFLGSLDFYNRPIHIKYTGLECIVNGVSLPVTGTKSVCNYPMYLGSVNQSGTALTSVFYRGADVDVYFCKIWKNGVLMRDYIPILDNEGTPAIYDRISQQLNYPSKGELTFGKQLYHLTRVPFESSCVYAHWGRKIPVVFDATTNGGQMPASWISPDYYEFQPYNTLPSPTKSGNKFLGWYTESDQLITADSLVKSKDTILIAKYGAS